MTNTPIDVYIAIGKGFNGTSLATFEHLSEGSSGHKTEVIALRPGLDMDGWTPAAVREALAMIRPEMFGSGATIDFKGLLVGTAGEADNAADVHTAARQIKHAVHNFQHALGDDLPAFVVQPFLKDLDSAPDAHQRDLLHLRHNLGAAHWGGTTFVETPRGWSGHDTQLDFGGSVALACELHSHTWLL